jgi:hypothetical protein
MVVLAVKGVVIMFNGAPVLSWGADSLVPVALFSSK